MTKKYKSTKAKPELNKAVLLQPRKGGVSLNRTKNKDYDNDKVNVEEKDKDKARIE